MIIRLIESYPEFRAMYEDVYRLCQNVEKVMEMFSEELRILDRNTVQYMIDEMQAEIDSQKMKIECQQETLEIQQSQLQERESQLQEERNLRLTETEERKRLEHRIAELEKQLDESNTPWTCFSHSGSRQRTQTAACTAVISRQTLCRTEPHTLKEF